MEIKAVKHVPSLFLLLLPRHKNNKQAISMFPSILMSQTRTTLGDKLTWDNLNGWVIIFLPLAVQLLLWVTGRWSRENPT